MQNRAQHENVTKVDGYVYYRNIPCIIMELMPFGSLSTLFLYRSSLTPLLCHRICCDIASGISHLHTLTDEQRLVHGDLKPENILLSETLQCKITDFSVASMAAYSTFTPTESESSASNLTKNTDPLTRVYAAPEILNLVRKRKRPCDVYSFSIIALEVVGWKRPDRESIPVFLEKVKNSNEQIYDIDEIDYVQGAVKGPNVTAKNIIESLTDAIEQCNQFYPKDRPSMEDVKNKLLEIWENCDTSEINKDVDQLKSSTLKRIFDEKQRHTTKPLKDYIPEFSRNFYQPGKCLKKFLALAADLKLKLL